MSKTINDWNRQTRHVDDTIQPGNFITSETCLLFSGPPQLSMLAATTGSVNVFDAVGSNDPLSGAPFYKIGTALTFQAQQSQRTGTIREIGGRRGYRPPGPVDVNGSIARITYIGDSLLSLCYKWYPNSVQLANGKTVPAKSATLGYPKILLPAGNQTAAIVAGVPAANGQAAVAAPPAGAFMYNMLSTLFSFPFGLGILLQDNRNRFVSAIYYEDAMILTHGLGVDANGQTVISENLSFVADMGIPLDMTFITSTA